MLIKILLAVVTTIIGITVGWRYSYKLTQKRKYFESLRNMLSVVTAEISYRQTCISDLLAPYLNDDSLLSTHVSEFISYAKSANTTLELTKSFLNEREHNLVFEVFSLLGRYDLGTQLSILDGQKMRLNDFCRSAEADEQVKGKNSKKLGFLLGLTVGILFL